MGEVNVDRLNKCIRGCENGGDVGKLYDEWSHYYDEDAKQFYLSGWYTVFEKVKKYFRGMHDIRVLEVGACTGTVGREDNENYNQAGWFTVFDTIETYFRDVRDIRVLEVGAGTGAVGKELKDLGYTNVDAVDASAESLKVAQTDDLYRRTYVQFVGAEPLPIPDNTYDCVIAVGVIAPNHMPAVALRDLCRVLKPGGVFIMQGNYTRWTTLREYHVTMAAMIDTMVTERKWQQEEWTIIPEYLNFKGDMNEGLVFAYRKL